MFLNQQQPLIPCVKTEAHRGGNNNNPYLAFRRRTEKMQTRKNRKNDETSYEKMVKLKRDLSRALTLLELIKRRENTKRELLHLTIEIYEKRQIVKSIYVLGLYLYFYIYKFVFLILNVLNKVNVFNKLLMFIVVACI